MSVNEKMIAIADNIREKTGTTEPLNLDQMAESIPEVYKAGQSSMVDESKIIEKTVTGTNIVVIDDTSEIPHDVGCKVESVNLFNVNGSLTDYIGWVTGETTLVDGKIKATADYTSGTGKGQFIDALPNTTYVVSYTVDSMEASGACGIWVVSLNSNNEKTFIYKIGNWGGVGSYMHTFTTLADTEKIWLSFLGVAETNGKYVIYDKVQLNEGDTALPYTPFVDVSDVNVTRYGESETDNLETYTPNADGTVDGIKSLCPVMTLSTDADGVVLTVDYHKSWGKQAEWSEFWDAYQDNGSRTNYVQAFVRTFWNHDSLKPKYDVQPVNATQMFYMLGYDNNLTFNLKELFEAAGVTLDFSKATNMNYCFQTSKITHLGVVDLTNCGSNLDNTFGNMYSITEIEKVIVSETNTFPNTFSECWASKIIFEGTIAADIKLNRIRCGKEGFESIIKCLSESATGKTLTLGLGNIKNAFETSEGAADGNTSEEWLNLVATKSNWTITLA